MKVEQTMAKSLKALSCRINMHKKMIDCIITMSNAPLQVKVQICVQFFKVGEIDTLKEQFTADVVVKAKWREPSLDGQNQTVYEINDNKKLASYLLYPFPSQFPFLRLPLRTTLPTLILHY